MAIGKRKVFGLWALVCGKLAHEGSKRKVTELWSGEDWRMKAVKMVVDALVLRVAAMEEE